MNTKVDVTIQAIKDLVTLFKTERMVYLVITLISVIVLISTAVFLIISSTEFEQTMAVLGLFGSTGGIAYSTGRLLKMWSEAMQLIHKVIDSTNGN